MNIFVDRIIELANIAYENDDIPVGAIVVRNDKIIGYGYNRRNSNGSVIGHAEIDAIEMACKFNGDWRLDDCDIYVTLVPCMMCTGAIIESRIKNVFYLCDRTNVCFASGEYLNLKKIDDVDRANQYMNLLQKFFEKKRNKS